MTQKCNNFEAYTTYISFFKSRHADQFYEDFQSGTFALDNSQIVKISELPSALKEYEHTTSTPSVQSTPEDLKGDIFVKISGLKVSKDITDAIRYALN